MIYRTCGLVLLALSLFAATADAKPRAPIVDATLGPVARNATPLILVFRALNPRDYAAPGPFTGGLIGASIGGISNSLYNKTALRAAETVRTGFPTLDVEREIRAAFRCGEAGSLCTEMVVLPQSSSETLDAALLAVLHSHQWKEARLVSFWWHLDEPRLSAHVALEPMELTPEDKLAHKPGTLVGYYWTAPPAKSPKNKDGGALPHAEEWEPGAAAPREQSILAGLANLERLAQAALSWNAPEAADHIESLPAFQQVDEADRLECTGLRQCALEKVEGLAEGNRVWVWALQRTKVYEFQSRPRIAP